MKNHNKEIKEEKKKLNTKTRGSAKEKASFDQNGKGASDKFGEAGETANESGDDNGPGTTNKNRNQ